MDRQSFSLLCAAALACTSPAAAATPDFFSESDGTIQVADFTDLFTGREIRVVESTFVEVPAPEEAFQPEPAPPVAVAYQLAPQYFPAPSQNNPLTNTHHVPFPMPDYGTSNAYQYG